MPDRLHGDAGIGLIEILMAVVLLGIGATAVMAALGTATKSSALFENQTRAFTALGIAAEAVSSPDVAYSACAGADPSAYEARVTAALNAAFGSVISAKRPSVAVSGVSYWDGSTFGVPCRDQPADIIPGFDRMQQITLTASVPGSTREFTIDVVKRAG